MDFSMAFGSAVGMPPLTMLAPNNPSRNALNDRFVGRKHGGIQIDDGVFGNWDFHFVRHESLPFCFYLILIFLYSRFLFFYLTNFIRAFPYPIIVCRYRYP